MADSGGCTQTAFILKLQDALRLEQVCPELRGWPCAWQVEPADIAIGQQIVRALTPFLIHLLDRGLARTTIHRHANNLWLLGAEIIRRRYDDDEFAQLDAAGAIGTLIGGDAGPLVWPRITETAQDSLDATCRKLDRYMRESAAGHSSA
jgi:hypothetical protein